jgi:hypothetical protein
MLSPEDGRAPTLLVSHGCVKGSKFSTQSQKARTHKALAVVNKGLNAWQEMKVGGGENRDWDKIAHAFQMGTIFSWEILSSLK